MDVVRMDNVLSTSPVFTDNTVSVNAYSNVSATQPGGTVSTGDCRTLNVEWNNNNMPAAFDSVVSSDPAAAWIQFNTSGFSWLPSPQRSEDRRES